MGRNRKVAEALDGKKASAGFGLAIFESSFRMNIPKQKVNEPGSRTGLG